MKYRFGDKLRAIRERRGLTLKQVAAAVGVTESQISQIERHKVMPAVDTLLDIAGFLNLDLEHLFSDFRKEHPVHVLKEADRPRFEAEGTVYELLSQSEQGEHGIEAYLLTVAPGSSQGSEEYGHIGKEMGIIIEGKAELSCGGRSYSAEAGDSLSFASDVPHILRNAGETPLKAFWVVTPPKGLKP
jgi:transcriptional regulator with XRE-family HTH domain